RLTLGSPTLLATNRHALVFVGSTRLRELCDVRRAPVDRQRPREQQPDERDRNVLNEREKERPRDGGILVESGRRRRERIQQLEHADVSRRESHGKAGVDYKKGQ